MIGFHLGNGSKKRRPVPRHNQAAPRAPGSESKDATDGAGAHHAGVGDDEHAAAAAGPLEDLRAAAVGWGWGGVAGVLRRFARHILAVLGRFYRALVRACGGRRVPLRLRPSLLASGQAHPQPGPFRCRKGASPLLPPKPTLTPAPRRAARASPRCGRGPSGGCWRAPRGSRRGGAWRRRGEGRRAGGRFQLRLEAGSAPSPPTTHLNRPATPLIHPQQQSPARPPLPEGPHHHDRHQWNAPLQHPPPKNPNKSPHPPLFELLVPIVDHVAGADQERAPLPAAGEVGGRRKGTGRSKVGAR